MAVLQLDILGNYKLLAYYVSNLTVKTGWLINFVDCYLTISIVSTYIFSGKKYLIAIKMLQSEEREREREREEGGTGRERERRGKKY